MSLRNSPLKENTINEIGKEFWGLLNFKANLVSLYSFLELDKISVSIQTFANWVVFPELIPSDIQKTIHKKLIFRYESKCNIKHIETTEDEKRLHNHTLELIQFKYSNRFSSPQIYYYLYQLPKYRFTKVLEQFQKYGYTDSEVIFEYYLYYSTLSEKEGT